MLSFLLRHHLYLRVRIQRVQVFHTIECFKISALKVECRITSLHFFQFQSNKCKFQMIKLNKVHLSKIVTYIED